MGACEHMAVPILAGDVANASSLTSVVGGSAIDFFVDRTTWPAAARQQRVALVTGSYDRNVDGVAFTLNRLVGHLVRRGHEVLVITPSSGRERRHPPRRGGRRQPSSQVRTAGAPLQHVPSVAFPIWQEYRLTWGLDRATRRRLVEFAPTVVHVAIQDAMGHAAQRWAHSVNVPVVCSHHTRFERYLGYYRLGFLEPLYWVGMRRFHARCAATLPPSASLASDLAAHGVPRVGVWPRGVDRTLFDPRVRSEAWRASIRGEVGAPIVLFVARLRWEKGLATFAQVIADLRARRVRHRVVIVGSGPARDGFAALLPDEATFLGTLTGATLAVAYASSDLFLYPSTTEGWGGTCLEAQASGVPVVATHSSGIVDVVAHGMGGFLAPPHNVSALADHASALLASEPLRATMSAAAARHAAAFDWARSGDRMLCEYTRVSDGVPPPPEAWSGRPPPAIADANASSVDTGWSHASCPALMTPLRATSTAATLASVSPGADAA